MLPFAVSHEVLARQRARDLLREAERAARLRTGRPERKEGQSVLGLLARIRQAVKAVPRGPARPSIHPAG